MTTAQTTVIRPRRRSFDFDGVSDRYWLGGDAFATRFFDAFSSMLPVGERFFIGALRRVEPEIRDADLEADIRGLVEQEAIHAREHRRYNARLRAMGFNLDRWDRSQARVMDRIQRARRPHIPLAVTVAIEHITAIIGRALLQRHLVDDRAHPTMQSFWRWHAAEELEHKDVAIRTYRAAGGGEGLRRTALAWAVLIITIRMTARVARMLQVDGKLARPHTWASGARFLGGKRGFVRVVARDFGVFFRRGFNPSVRDDHSLLATWAREDAAASGYQEAAADQEDEAVATSPPAGSHTTPGPRPKVVPARTSALFQALDEMGENMHFTVQLQRDGEVVVAHDLHHRDFDGYGAITAVLTEQGVTFAGPPPREDAIPSLPARIAVFREVMRTAKTEPFTLLRDMRATQPGAERTTVGRVLTPPESDAVRAAAASAGVSPNSWLLWALNATIGLRLSRQADASWGVPVNMRGPIAVDPPLANCSSIVPVTLPAAASPHGVQEAVWTALDRNLHWGKWDQVNLMARMGLRGARRQVRQYYETVGVQRVGIFSNVGEWHTDPADLAAIVHGVPTKADPFFAGAMTMNGLVALSCRTHAGLDVTRDELESWLEDWAARVTAPYEGSRACGGA